MVLVSEVDAMEKKTKPNIETLIYEEREVNFDPFT